MVQKKAQLYEPELFINPEFLFVLQCEIGPVAGIWKRFNVFREILEIIIIGVSNIKSGFSMT